MFTRPRIYEGGFYHGYNRGVAKLPIFLDEDDYKAFLEILYYYLIGFHRKNNLPSRKWAENKPVSFTASKTGNGMFNGLVDLLAYCLMPNHFHLLLRICKVSHTLQNPISELVRRVSITYSHRFNQKHDRVGPLYQGRYKLKEVTDGDQLIHLTRYIHLNPVMAHIVSSPEEWQWSDYSACVDLNKYSTKLSSQPELVLEYFDGKPKNYKQFVVSQTDKCSDVLLKNVKIES